jgi:hypothetical protein
MCGIVMSKPEEKQYVTINTPKPVTSFMEQRLNTALKWRSFVKDCLAADICPMCGEELAWDVPASAEDEFRRDRVCRPCGFYHDYE